MIYVTLIIVIFIMIAVMCIVNTPAKYRGTIPPPPPTNKKKVK